MALPGLETLGDPPDTDRLARLLAAFGRTAYSSTWSAIGGGSRRRREQSLLDLAGSLGLRAVATNGVRHASRAAGALLDVMTCIREKRKIQDGGPAARGQRRAAPEGPARWPRSSPTGELLRNNEALAERLEFTLDDLGYRFPDYPVPRGRPSSRS